MAKGPQHSAPPRRYTSFVSTAKDQLHRLIDAMSDGEAENLLAYLQFQADPELLTWEEDAITAEGAGRIGPGSSLTLEQLRDLFLEP